MELCYCSVLFQISLKDLLMDFVGSLSDLSAAPGCFKSLILTPKPREGERILAVCFSTPWTRSCGFVHGLTANPFFSS